MNFREKPDHVRQVVRERGYVAPVLLDESGDVTGKAYGVWGPPTAYFIDREGRLIGHPDTSRQSLVVRSQWVAVVPPGGAQTLVGLTHF